MGDLYEQTAKKILSESLHVKKGETITVETWNNGLDFARAVVKEARRRGALSLILLEDEEAYIDAARNMPKDVVGTMGRHEQALVAGTDAYVFIPGPILGPFTKSLTRQEANDSTRYNASWYDAAEKAKLRGVRMNIGYLGGDVAKLLGRSVDQLLAHQLKAGLADLDATVKRGAEVAAHLKDGASATLVTDRMKLEFQFKGDLSIEDGIVDERDVSEGYNVTYFPSGYVSKTLDMPTVAGEVKISNSVSRLGIVKDAILSFEGGKLTRWKSKGSQRILDELIEGVPEDARGLRGVTIGLNGAARYGFSLDRFVAGSIGLTGFGFTGIVPRGSLTVGGRLLVDKGHLSP